MIRKDKTMRTYTVSSGTWKAKVRADTPEEAAAKAIKRDAPKSLGMLVQIECKDSPSVFWDVRQALKLAGIKAQ